jgi:hypothetical protein
MLKRAWLIVSLLLGLSMLAGLPATAAGPLADTTPVASFPEWVNFYGTNSTFNGVPLPAGSEVVAYADQKRCGSFVVQTPGQYGLLPCYRDQPDRPGALPGDRIRFTVNGFEAIVRGPDEPIWTSNGDRRHVELEASGTPQTPTPTYTRTVMPTSTRTSTPPGGPTSTPVTPPTSTPIVPPTPTPIAPPTPTPIIPPSPTVWVPPTPTTPPAGVCREMIQDGSFESGFGWTIDPAPRPAGRTTAQGHAGAYSMRLGITDASSNVSSPSAVRQRIQIAPDATQALLTFFYYPTSEPDPRNDYWEVLLLQPGTNNIVTILWRNAAGDERRWLQMTFNLVGFAGGTYDLYFNMYNDGTGGASAMYLDDVSLAVCTSGLPTATPTVILPRTNTPTYVAPTPWPTAAGGACQEMVANGDFEAGTQGWYLGPTKRVPAIISDPRHGGNRAIQLGIPDGVNVNTFSSIRQTVNIPSDAVSADLTFWTYLMSTETAGQDHQEMVLLSPTSGATIAIGWRVMHDNTRNWVQQRVDLMPYAGQSLVVYFNAYNDGADGTTAMVLDDVSLRVCRNIPPTAIPLSNPTVTATALVIPTAAGGSQGGAAAAPTITLARPTPAATPASSSSTIWERIIIAVGAGLVMLILLALVVYAVKGRDLLKPKPPAAGGATLAAGSPPPTGGRSATPGATPAVQSRMTSPGTTGEGSARAGASQAGSATQATRMESSQTSRVTPFEGTRTPNFPGGPGGFAPPAPAGTTPPPQTDDATGNLVDEDDEAEEDTLA